MLPRVKATLNLSRTVKKISPYFLWPQIKQGPERTVLNQNLLDFVPEIWLLGIFESHVSQMKQILLDIIYGLVLLHWGDEKTYPNIMIPVCSM